MDKPRRSFTPDFKQEAVELSTLRIPLDEAASLRITCGQDVPAPLTVPSLALTGPSSRDRFSSLRRSNA